MFVLGLEGTRYNGLGDETCGGGTQVFLALIRSGGLPISDGDRLLENLGVQQHGFITN